MVLPRLAEETMGGVLDLTMPHLSGQALLEQITASSPDLPAIVMTATQDRVRRLLHLRPARHRMAGLVYRALHITAAPLLSPFVAGE